jgi:hypothetical protein
LAAYRLSLPYERPPLRRRASGLALALCVNLVLLLVLLRLGIIALPIDKPLSTALVIDLQPESHSVKQQAAAKAKPRKPEAKVRPKPAATPPITSPIPSPHPLPWIEMSHDELASADLRNLPKAGSGSAGDSEEVGRGPHGEVLYNAEWAREPTHAELAGYLPHNAPDGHGLVACKTIPGNRVEDCVELENDPPGSHLARAVRLAAWQFHVRPPRRNGKPMVGEWVRIRIDYITQHDD